MHKHTEPAVAASEVGEMRTGRAPTSTTWAQKLALIGPAFIAGAWQFGPGNLTSAVEAGSAYGYALVWVIAVSTLLMIFFTDMSVRIGIAAPGTMIATIKRILGKPWGVVAGLSVFFITLCFSVGNAAGSGLALSMLFGGSALLWTAVCTIGVAFVLLMRNIYTAVERILLVLVAMMAVGFIASAFLAGPDWGAGVGGMVPSFPPGAELLIIALVGTNFSINAAFFTSYATRERGIRADQYRDATITDTIPGIVAPGHHDLPRHHGRRGGPRPHRREGHDAGAARQRLRAAGRQGRLDDLRGRLLRRRLLVDARQRHRRRHAARRRPRRGAAASTGCARSSSSPASSASASSWSPWLPGSRVQLIIFAQAMTVLVAPFLGAMLLVIANNRLMGDLRNRWWQNLLGGIGFLAILATSGLLVARLTGMAG